MDKVFAIVVQNSDGEQHVQHIEAGEIRQFASDKFQAEFFIKHAKKGEFAIISGTVVFCQKDS